MAREAKLILFQLGNEVYAVDLRYVREVVNSSNTIRVPGAQDFVKGVMDLRGRVLTLIDLARILGTESDAHSKVLVYLDNKSDAPALGFVVDQVLGVITVKENEIERPPLKLSELVKGYVRTDRGIVTVLDIEKVAEQVKKELGGEEP